MLMHNAFSHVASLRFFAKIRILLISAEGARGPTQVKSRTLTGEITVEILKSWVKSPYFSRILTIFPYTNTHA